MSAFEQPPFGRGKTYNPGAAATDGAEWIGREYWFDDYNWNSNPITLRSNRKVKCRVVRNSCASAGNAGGQVSTGALLPKRLAAFKSGTYNAEMDGYAGNNARADYSFPVDEFLPAAGVAVNDLFYIVVEGPALVLLPLTTQFSADIAVGDRLVAISATTSGATSAGRASPPVYTNATSGIIAEIEVLNAIGRALSACTSNATTGTNSILVDVKSL